MRERLLTPVFFRLRKQYPVHVVNVSSRQPGGAATAAVAAAATTEEEKPRGANVFGKFFNPPTSLLVGRDLHNMRQDLFTYHFEFWIG